jgi:hypothetical protein
LKPYNFKAILLYLAALTFCNSCDFQNTTKKAEQDSLNFSDTTYLTLAVNGFRQTSPPVKTSISYYQIIPGWIQDTEAILVQQDTLLHFQIYPQHAYYAHISIADEEIPFFIAPGDSITLQLDMQRLSHLTEALTVNKHIAETNYLLAKREQLGEYHIKQYEILLKETNAAVIEEALNQFMEREIAYYQGYLDSVALPEYFKNQEDHEIRFKNADSKLTAEGYITGYLGKKVQFPDAYYNFIKQTDIHMAGAAASPRYLDYMDGLSYFYYASDSLQAWIVLHVSGSLFLQR